MFEVKACCLCHSDLHFAESDFGVPLPAVLGHELAGVVGPDVREFQPGDHVVGLLIQFYGLGPDSTVEPNGRDGLGGPRS